MCKLKLGRAHLIKDTLVDDPNWHELELDFALERAEEKEGKPKSLSHFWERLVKLSEKIQREHAQRNFLKKSSKDEHAAAIQKEVVAEQ